MSILQTLGQGQGYLKAGFLGLNKSGKSYTSALLAIVVREMFNLPGPIGFYDAEGGSEYIAPIVRASTGLDLVGVRSRSFSDLTESTAAAEAEGVSVWICDVTQPWRELCESYLAQVNEVRSRDGLLPRKRLVMGDWNVLKSEWNNKWASLYVNSRLHIIANGRAGFEWDFEDDTEGDGVRLVKTGLKMKTEGEFGFEPSLLVEMEQLHEFIKPSVRRKSKTPKAGVLVSRAATVMGDRFGAIDGAYTTFTTVADKYKQKGEVMEVDLKKLDKEVDAVRNFFGSHLRLLVPGAHAPVDVRMKTDLNLSEGGDTSYRNEQRLRTILAEEIEGIIKTLYPRQTDVDKKARLTLLQEIFGTRSWTAVSETLSSAKLREGLGILRATLAAVDGAGTPGGIPLTSDNGAGEPADLVA